MGIELLCLILLRGSNTILKHVHDIIEEVNYILFQEALLVGIVVPEQLTDRAADCLLLVLVVLEVLVDVQQVHVV